MPKALLHKGLLSVLFFCLTILTAVAQSEDAELSPQPLFSGIQQPRTLMASATLTSALATTTRPGDCDGNGSVNAGDISASILEIKDGDGNFWLDAPGGSRAFTPQCDANTDTLITATDVTCIGRLIFGGACDAPGSHITSSALQLGNGTGISGTIVTLPLTVTSNGNAIANGVFSIDYDENCLSVGSSTAIHLPQLTPADAVYNIGLDSSDVDSEIDIIFAKIALPSTPITDGVVVTIDFTLVCQPAPDHPVTAFVNFATDLPVSLGVTTGGAVPVTTSNGSIQISAATATPTATSTPMPTATVTPTATATPPSSNGQLPLVTGWSLIALPIIPTDNASSVVFSPIAGNYNLVYAYSGCDANDPWKKYDPAAPFPFLNDLTSVGVSQGLWLRATNNVTLTVTGADPANTSIALCAGWNLISWPGNAPTPVATALVSIAGQYNLIYAYAATDGNDPWKKYDPAAPFPFLNDLSQLEPGKGYWIRATQATTLIVP